jgi:hypothetical protein
VTGDHVGGHQVDSWQQQPRHPTVQPIQGSARKPVRLATRAMTVSGRATFEHGNDPICRVDGRSILTGHDHGEMVDAVDSSTSSNPTSQSPIPRPQRVSPTR